METAKPRNPEFRRTEDFVDVYANNINFEASTFDLKILFGQLNQSFDPNIVEQHTAVTVAWAEAKLFLHFLGVQLAAFEEVNGKILLPAAVLPAAPIEPDEQVAKAEPKAVRVYQLIKRIHDEFVKNSIMPNP
jgi:uncharacterized protein DUF3467